MAQTGANVLSVAHDRSTLDIPLGYAKVKLELETADKEHVAKLRSFWFRTTTVSPYNKFCFRELNVDVR